MAEGRRKNEGMMYSGWQISPDARRDIFISYRHVGGGDFARSMNEYLEQALYNVFYDVEDMGEGRFNIRLLSTIRNCTDYLLVLPPNGLDRCNDPNDWVMQEIECALKHKKNIIPIMLNGFVWPDPTTLPVSLQKIHLYQAVKHSHENFEFTMQQIIGMLHSKPFFTRAAIIPPPPEVKPRRVVFERLIIALVTLAIGIGGTLIAQSVMDPVPTTPLAITAAPAYVTKLIIGSAIDQAVRRILGIPSGSILKEDAEGIAEMDLSGLALTDIGELAEFTGLKTLDLHNNRISDLTPLSGMVGLESLLIYKNEITSLQPLAGLTKLTILSAEDNQIVEVSPLAGLTELQKLYLQNNRITDVSPLRNLVHLERLALDGNPVTDYTPLVNLPTTVFQIPQQ
jgi:hypothetical protein